MFKSFSSVLILVGYLSLMGCGTQGPLYIPEQRYPQKEQQDSVKTPAENPTKKLNSKD